MKQHLPFRVILIPIAIILLVLASGLVFTSARGVSIGELVGLAMPGSAKPRVVVAKVNDESILLSTLEMARLSLQSLSKSALSNRDAYKQALDYHIRGTVLRQEAKRRGLQASDQEAHAAWQENLALLNASPEARKFNDDMAKGSGLSRAEFEARQIEAVKNGILGAKVREQWAQQAPRATPEDINAYLAKLPKPNTVILIPIEFASHAQGEQVYRELESLKQTQTLDEFTTTFDSYARQIGNKGKTEFVHKKFGYTKIAELSDFAQDAAEKPEGSMGLYSRADGSAVIYLVLKQVVTDSTDPYEQAAQRLNSEKQKAYIESQLERLVQQAKIEIFYDRFPPEARPN